MRKSVCSTTRLLCTEGRTETWLAALKSSGFCFHFFLANKRRSDMVLNVCSFVRVVEKYWEDAFTGLNSMTVSFRFIFGTTYVTLFQKRRILPILIGVDLLVVYGVTLYRTCLSGKRIVRPARFEGYTCDKYVVCALLTVQASNPLHQSMLLHCQVVR